MILVQVCPQKYTKDFAWLIFSAYLSNTAILKITKEPSWKVSKEL
jgi:hypothetical protein